jgi:cytochrome c peroxidase
MIRINKFKKISWIGIALLLVQCQKNQDVPTTTYPAIQAQFGSTIDPAQLIDYAGQSVPSYIGKDAARTNPLKNPQAMLGRVLFYDKSLSVDNSLSCASCHKQEFAFSDTALISDGVSNGVTVRHAMRLVNNRFAMEQHFFWNERAASLEEQTTLPIQDHAEMGFSGQNGRPNLNALLTKLQSIDYYQELFQFVYGDKKVTEQRLQECLANFVRSIQSFDSRYDAGRSLVPNDGAPFPNYTQQENLGKNLWLAPPVFDASGSRIGGGLGCNGCHAAPEFDIDPRTLNNGVIGIINGNGIDLNNTKAPSLRDLVNPAGVLNGPMMHTGNFTTLKQVVGHYGKINLAPGNTNLDPRLRPNGNGQQLNLTADEVNAVVAFIQTLSGNKLYQDQKWGDPFK